jgi:hypothetical protein
MTQFKFLLFSLLLINCFSIKKGITNPSSDLEIIDISALELRLFNQYKNHAIEERNLIFLDSIYRPYTHLWKGYLGDEKEFITWVNTVVYKELALYNEKAKRINLNKMNTYFNQTAKEMAAFTGFSPKGKWYIFFGPKWTNLGGFGDGAMLIDLANEHNQSLEDIIEAFPHEINHQIYTNRLPNTEYNVISRIIDEGFACYVSKLFRKGKTTMAQELNYTEEAYQNCLKYEDKIIKLIRNNYTSTNKDDIDRFVSRGHQFSEKLPTAIGYFIGYRIVEEYVKKHGKDSWKDLYEIDPIEVLHKSGILH